MQHEVGGGCRDVVLHWCGLVSFPGLLWALINVQMQRRKARESVSCVVTSGRQGVNT